MGETFYESYFRQSYISIMTTTTKLPQIGQIKGHKWTTRSSLSC